MAKAEKVERKETAYVIFEIVMARREATEESAERMLREIGIATTNRGPQHAITIALETIGREDDEGEFKAVPATSAKTHVRTIKEIKEPRWQTELAL